MNKDIKELRELGYTDAEIANILADGDENVADEISEEIKKADAVQTEDEVAEDQDETVEVETEDADDDKDKDIK